MQRSHTLQRSYTWLAPVYDSVVAWPTRQIRQHSLAQLNNIDGQCWLIDGIGSGLDFPYLPKTAHYVGVDITAAMLQRARQRLPNDLTCHLHQADVMQLPYPDHCFDGVIMHLILAVVPDAQQALNEALRVLKPNGQLLILDKFLRPQQFAPVRRLLNPLFSRIATRTDVEFDSLDLAQLHVTRNDPALAGGWFRLIHAIKQS